MYKTFDCFQCSTFFNELVIFDFVSAQFYNFFKVFKTCSSKTVLFKLLFSLFTNRVLSSSALSFLFKNVYFVSFNCTCFTFLRRLSIKYRNKSMIRARFSHAHTCSVRGPIFRQVYSHALTFLRRLTVFLSISFSFVSCFINFI